MRTVYVVECGEYEQRGIAALFADEATARAYVVRGGDSSAEVTAYDVFDHLPQQATLYHATQWVAQDTGELGKYEAGTWPTDETSGPFPHPLEVIVIEWRRFRGVACKNVLGEQVRRSWTVEVRGHDPDGVQRVLAERVATLRATVIPQEKEPAHEQPRG